MSADPPLSPIGPRPTGLTGLLLGERYRIEHRVGEGGMAHVYFARDLERSSETAAAGIAGPLAGG